jgi:energy-converting hydrogenase Eha subunit F
MLAQLASIQKFLASAIGVLLVVLTYTHNLPFVPAQWESVVGVVIAVLTPISTWLVKNKTA